ncbi:hypothetical protein [Bizionia myxarmorum]|uniref:Uncharacterized protein n=1 Tax=Bizionia myxarmorum TaxID=291186 RepID=A0A5D0RDJ2_9FLAO|nr:hypothetical protein [Bizionia myxarmorum]TYB79657.1 hypothetical protein ES674_07875 [Bizionia myxarmorum]
MKQTNIVLFFIIALCVAFTFFQISGKEYLSNMSKALIAPLFTVLYFINVQERSRYFMLFLLVFSFSELSVFVEYSAVFGKLKRNLVYVIGNSLYIVAYCFLIAEVFKTINVRNVLKNYFIHIIVLMVLSIYISYVLLTIVNPRFTYTEESLIIIELVYNIVMLLLLMVSIISYFYNDNKKTLFLFLGSICIVFSEVIQIAYFYVTDQDVLNIVQTLLFVMAFTFFYFQSKVKNKKVQFFA